MTKTMAAASNATPYLRKPRATTNPPESLPQVYGTPQKDATEETADSSAIDPI
jgi:hypothetical protein